MISNNNRLHLPESVVPATYKKQQRAAHPSGFRRGGEGAYRPPRPDGGEDGGYRRRDRGVEEKEGAAASGGKFLYAILICNDGLMSFRFPAIVPNTWVWSWTAPCVCLDSSKQENIVCYEPSLYVRFPCWCCCVWCEERRRDV